MGKFAQPEFELDDFSDDADFDWTAPPELVASAIAAKPALVATAASTASKDNLNSVSAHSNSFCNSDVDDDNFDWTATPKRVNKASVNTALKTLIEPVKDDNFDNWTATPETTTVLQKNNHHHHQQQQPKKKAKKIELFETAASGSKEETNEATKKKKKEEDEKEKKAQALAAIEQLLSQPNSRQNVVNNGESKRTFTASLQAFVPLPDCHSPGPRLLSVELTQEMQQMVLPELELKRHHQQAKKMKTEAEEKGEAGRLNWHQMINLETFRPLSEAKLAAVEDQLDRELYQSWMAYWRRWRDEHPELQAQPQSQPQNQVNEEPQEKEQQQQPPQTPKADKKISFSANLRATAPICISPIQPSSSSSPSFVHRAAFTATMVSYGDGEHPKAATTTTTTSTTSQQFTIQGGGSFEPTVKMPEAAQKLVQSSHPKSALDDTLGEGVRADPTPVLVPLRLSSRVSLTPASTAGSKTSASPSSSSVRHQSQVKLTY